MTTLAQDKSEGAIVHAVQQSVGRYPVLLWGSRANGRAEADSDYDVFVVVPARKLPAALGRLKNASRALADQLGVPVSLSPLPKQMLRPSDRRLAYWKLCRESRVLSAPPEFALAPPSPPHLTPLTRFSYSVSAVFYLLERSMRGTRKALLHVAQLRLMQAGAYAVELEQVLEALGDPRLTSLAGRLDHPAAWFDVRREVLAEANRPDRSAHPFRTLVVNAQYATLAKLSGTPHWQAALTRQPVELRIADAAVGLLSAVGPDGEVDAERLGTAVRSLPVFLRPKPDATWEQVRDLLAREWPLTHPLVGL